MASPESIAAAFAEGMMRAMLAQPEAKAKPEKPKVVKVPDVEAAVAKYLDAKLADAPQPAQEELFQQPGVIDFGEEMYRRHLQNIEDAQARAEAREQQEDGIPAGYFDANAPGEKRWTAPGQ